VSWGPVFCLAHVHLAVTWTHLSLGPSRMITGRPECTDLEPSLLPGLSSSSSHALGCRAQPLPGKAEGGAEELPPGPSGQGFWDQLDVRWSTGDHVAPLEQPGGHPGLSWAEVSAPRPLLSPLLRPT
jgi:hypothetical protein